MTAEKSHIKREFDIRHTVKSAAFGSEIQKRKKVLVDILRDIVAITKLFYSSLMCKSEANFRGKQKKKVGAE